ncbi:hypothetical protein [Streptomyces sp. bgisy095]|uniref:hypothetical protein n=1 Tax=unclassified Streptomyces TaxID=2593676 RepID=UPI003D754EE2
MGTDAGAVRGGGSGSGASGGGASEVPAPEDADPAATGTDAYTPMLAVAPGAAARACGTLADGTGACTAGP